MRRRRRLVERIEVPGLDVVLKVPAYGARFAVSSVLRAGRRGRQGDVPDGDRADRSDDPTPTSLQ
ncbi:MAG: hypothetical protein ACRDUY_07830 [Nitriliruptorales bacterium]